MDEFFQELREIQKKERNLGSLAPVGEDFYQQISSYFNKLMERIDNNPFSFESYLLRDAQRIVVEICERREYKITNSAVMNAQRSHHLFKNSKIDSRPKVPINSTPEEQKLYMELYSSLTAYREEMRSPLLSYSHKKEIKSSSFSPSRSSYSVDNEGSLDKDNVSESIVSGNESPLSKEIGKKPTSRSPPLDEIPPDIQDEIYRQFGREPSKQDSKHSSAGSAVETAIDSSPKTRGSENGNNVPGDFEAVSGQKTVHLEDEPVLDNAKDTGSKISTEVLMILEELPSIMGVDRKVYGPFHPGDIITMPEPNARILIKNQKGKSIQRYK